MITKEQFDNLKVGDRVLHSFEMGFLTDLYGLYGVVTNRTKNIIYVKWLNTSHDKQEYSLSSLACLDPCPPLIAMNINEII